MQGFQRAFTSIASPGAWGMLAVSTLLWLAFVLADLDAGTIEAQASEADWERRAPLLLLTLFLPTALVVLSLRAALPIFGPQDAGRRLLPLHARRPVRARFAAIAGVFAAWLVLQGAAALALGIGLRLAGHERLRSSTPIQMEGAPYLVKRGDRLRFELAATSPHAMLRLEPHGGFGLASLGLASTYDLLAPSGSRTSFELVNAGAWAHVPIGEHERGTWILERSGGEGSGTDFRGGKSSLEDGEVSTWLAGLALALSQLPRQALLVAIAVALARFVGPFVHVASMASVLVASATLEGALGPSLGDVLARVAVPVLHFDRSDVSTLVAAAVLVALAAIYPPRKEELC